MGEQVNHGGKRNGAGRRPIFDKTHLTQIRVNQAIWDAIPAPKAAWVREAIEEKAKKENLTTGST
jgi:hypothetical protein